MQLDDKSISRENEGAVHGNMQGTGVGLEGNFEEIARRFCEEEYKRLDKMMWKTIWSFHNSTGIPVEELRSESNLSFMIAFDRWEPDKADFQTILYTIQKNQLKIFCEKYFRDKNHYGMFPIPEDYPDYPDNRPSPRRACMVADEIKRLTEVGQEVVKVLFECPQEILALGKTKTKNFIKNSLKERWAKRTIEKSFKEITELLKHL